MTLTRTVDLNAQLASTGALGNNVPPPRAWRTPAPSS